MLPDTMVNSTHMKASFRCQVCPSLSHLMSLWNHNLTHIFPRIRTVRPGMVAPSALVISPRLRSSPMSHRPPHPSMILLTQHPTSRSTTSSTFSEWIYRRRILRRTIPTLAVAHRARVRLLRLRRRWLRPPLGPRPRRRVELHKRRCVIWTCSKNA